jgi:hypothetical protein
MLSLLCVQLQMSGHGTPMSLLLPAHFKPTFVTLQPLLSRCSAYAYPANSLQAGGSSRTSSSTSSTSTAQ